MFFTKKKSGEATLVVDVGSSSVGAAIVLVSKSITPEILWSTRLPIALQNESERGRSLTAMLQTLESVMQAVVAEHKHIHKTHVIFSPPWYVSETNISKISYDAPKLITRGVIEQLTKEAEKKNIEDFSSKGEIVEHRIIGSRLNGYNTSNPYNKKARSVEIAFFVSAVAKDVLESVCRVVGKHFHIKSGDVSSFSLVAFSTISKILPNEQDYLIVDIRGEETDLSSVINGVLMKSSSFSQGKNALVQTVIGSSGQSPAAALSLISTTLHGNSESSVQADITKALETFKQAWLQDYTKTSQDMPTAPTFFLMADSDIELFFENILNEIKNDGKLHLLKQLNLKDHVKGSSVLVDPFLALESIFVTMI